MNVIDFILLGCQKGNGIEPHIYYALALLLASFLVITAGRVIVRLLVWVSLVKVGQSRWGCIVDFILTFTDILL